MNKLNQVSILLLFTAFFVSCKGQSKADEICVVRFKSAKELAYANPTRQSALDSALGLINNCMQCGSIRNAVVEFKITLLVSMKKYTESINFIDSLREDDFIYGYKKKFMLKGIQALRFSSNNDTISQKKMYQEIACDIEQYINGKTELGDNEFTEIYTDLFAAKEKYLDTYHINEEVEMLKSKYPAKKSFFDFFKRQ